MFAAERNNYSFALGKYYSQDFINIRKPVTKTIALKNCIIHKK